MDITSSGTSTRWPQDWYVRVGELVEGPFPTELVFRLRDITITGEQRYVCRKGMKQWYRIPDLAEIYRNIEPERGNDHVRKWAQKVEMETFIKRTAQKKSKFSPPTTHRNFIESQPTAYQGRLDNRNLQAYARRLTQDLAVTKVKGLQFVDPGQREEDSLTLFATPKSFLSTEQRIFAEYPYLAQEMRLGDQRLPVFEGFIKFIASFGWYWLPWLRRSLQEVDTHLGVKKSIAEQIGILFLLPGFHFLAVYELARRMPAMESQNNYQATSVSKALLFACAPPLVIYYLQVRLNKHWHSHCKHHFKNRS